MKPFFQRLFQLFPGEGREAFLFALLGFLWAFAAAAGLKFSDALFLLHIGADNLPIAYSISAGLLIFSASFLIWGFSRFPTYIVFSVVLAFSALFYITMFLFFSLTPPTSNSPVWYSLKIFGTLQFSVMVTSFWTFIDDFFHLQDAKRLFGLFNSMIFLGIALTGLIMLLGVVEFESLSLLIALAQVAAIFLVQKIRQTIAPVHDDRHIEGELFGDESSAVTFFKAIIGSRFTLLLMSANFLTYVLMILTEFNVLSSFNSYFVPQVEITAGDEAESALTHFMGKALATISLSNLLFGLFFYSRLLRRFGIAKLLLITPSLLIMTYLGWIAEDTLFFALMGYFIVEGTFYVVDDANFTILLNGIKTPIKHKVRVLIESFMEPFGTLAAALLIAFSPFPPKLAALLLASLFLIIQLYLGKNYIRALYLNLKENSIDFKKTIRDWTLGLTKKQKKEKLFQIFAWLRLPLSSRHFAADLLIRMQESGAIDKILYQADSFEPSEKKELLLLLEESTFKDHPKVIEKCEEWLLQNESPDLQQELLWFLAKSGFIHPDKLMDDLNAPEMKKRAPAIASLITCRGNLSLEEAFRNKKIATEQVEALLLESDPEALQWGLKLLRLSLTAADIDVVFPFLFDERERVSKEAALTVKECLDPKAISYGPRLIEAISQVPDSETRLLLLDTVAPFLDGTLIREVILNTIHLRPQERRHLQKVIEALGLKNIPLLLSILRDPALPDPPRLISARILAALSLPQLKSHLEEVLRELVIRGAFAFYFRHKKFTEIPAEELGLLHDGLASAFYSTVDFAIELLSLAGELEEGELLSQAMRSSNLKMQSHVLEALEKCSEPRIFQLLFPLVDASPLEVKLSHMRKWVSDPELSFASLLEELENSSILSNEILAYYYMKKTDHLKWREKLKKKMVEKDEVFKTFAFELLEATIL